jgi:hypothetical protein
VARFVLALPEIAPDKAIETWLIDPDGRGGIGFRAPLSDDAHEDL